MHKSTFVALGILILFSFKANCQEKWKSRFGTWINIDLLKKMRENAPFSATAFISPRSVWLENLKAITIEQLFEQEHSHKIIKMDDQNIFTRDEHFYMSKDTLIMKRNYNHKISKLLKYQKM